MSKVKIESEFCRADILNVSNVTHIEIKTPTYDERGEIDGFEPQYLSFDTHGGVLKDFIVLIKDLEKEL